MGGLVVRRWCEALRTELGDVVVDVVPTLVSVLVRVGAGRIGDESEAAALVERVRAVSAGVLDGFDRESHAEASGDEGGGREVVIRVRYGGSAGPDLADVAARAGMTVEEAVAMHAGGSYRVAFLGFAPGFAYLSGLPERLASPRLESPRVRVPGGSVGIAGMQTGVYPGESPGGWRIIGRTDAVLFDPERDPPNALSAGDVVRFVPVDVDGRDVDGRGGGAAGDAR